MNQQVGYLLEGGKAELERLTLQARVWKPEVDRFLDEVGIRPEMHCIDLGCGAMGILPSLAERIQTGRVVGLDNDPKLLSAAQALISEEAWTQVELIEGDAYQTGLPDASFDFTHVRFVFAPVGRNDALLREMIRITKPGGIIAVQEPDASSWRCYPDHPEWHVLKNAILEAFRAGGGSFDAGQQTYAMLANAGLQEPQIRAAILALHNQHPYMRSPLQFAVSLRQRILASGILSEAALDHAVEACTRLITDPQTVVLSFTVTQVWARKPI